MKKPRTSPRSIRWRPSTTSRRQPSGPRWEAGHQLRQGPRQKPARQV